MDRVADRLDGPVRLPEGLKSIGMGLGANGAPLQDVASELIPIPLKTFHLKHFSKFGEEVFNIKTGSFQLWNFCYFKKNRSSITKKLLFHNFLSLRILVD